MFYNIQALRGIAALLVVMHHALPHFKAMNLSNTVFEFIAKFGYIGVDVFFVISGFVMALTTKSKKHGVPNSVLFLKKRFSRIYLGYWPIFILAFIYYYAVSPNYLADKEILQSFLLINSNMFDLVISPTWSLTYESYFYLIIGLLLLSPKLKPLSVFTFLLIAVVIKNIFIKLGEYKFIDFFFSSLLFEFIGGYILYYFINLLSSKKFIYISAIIVCISFSIGIYLNIGYGYIRVMTFGVFAFTLVWLFIVLEKNNIIKLRGLFSKVGNSSYTLYLIHPVLIGAFYTLGIRDYLVAHNLALIGFIVYLVLIVFISLIFYKFIEQPLYQFFRKKMVYS